MRLLNFLNEDLSDEIIDEIKANCSKILGTYGKTKKFIYRGEDSGTPFISQEIPKNRKPRDSIPQFHDILNSSFKNIFGKNLRSESIFCIGSLSYASEFGFPYVIFPYDDFNVYWSPTINDIAAGSWIRYVEKIKDKNIVAFMMIRCLSYKYADFGKDYIKNHVDDIKNNEIEEKLYQFFKTKNWYNSAEKLKICENIIKAYPNCGDAFVKKFYKKGNVEKAIESNCEMMITGSKYCAIKWSEKNKKLIDDLI